jgi:hypothetical protein
MEYVSWFSMILASLVPLLIGSVYFYGSKFGIKLKESLRINYYKTQILKGLLVFTLSFFIAFFLLGDVNQPGQEGEFNTFSHGAWHGAYLAILVAMPIVTVY